MWLVVVLSSAGGLLVALVIKYADNILKNFASAIAIISSVIVSAVFLGFKVTLGFIIGTCLVILAVYIYTSSSANPTKVESVLSKHQEIKGDEESVPIE